MSTPVTAVRGTAPNLPLPASKAPNALLFRGFQGFNHTRGPTSGRPCQRRMSTFCKAPVENAVHSIFVPVREVRRGARKKIFSDLGSVIHKWRSNSVDSTVEKLWTSAPALWVTGLQLWTEFTHHPITGPQPHVDNLGKTCGRSCGCRVDNLWAHSFIHSDPEFPTASPTGPVDKNSVSDLQRQWLSTLSTGPTTTAHLE